MQISLTGYATLAVDVNVSVHGCPDFLTKVSWISSSFIESLMDEQLIDG